MYLSYKVVGERNKLGRIPLPPLTSTKLSTELHHSLEKEDTVEGYLCRAFYRPKLKQEVEVGDLGS